MLCALLAALILSSCGTATNDETGQGRETSAAVGEKESAEIQSGMETTLGEIVEKIKSLP